jgi:SpoVK/Ycf46/Vps4 family AAA+-type ATPase
MEYADDYNVYISAEEIADIDDNFNEITFDNIDSLDKIIDLGQKYKDLLDSSKSDVKYDEKTETYEFDGKRYVVDLRKLVKLISPLKKLNRMVGLNEVKKTIITFIAHYLQERKHNQMLHTIIEGQPGVGKTRLGKIIAEIYHSLGIIPSARCKIVTRSDLVAKYSGQTAAKTRKVFEEADGGVVIIDEFYTLGTGDEKSFGRKSIDEINDILEKMKSKVILVAMGYVGSTKKYIFKHNEGLKRRFPFIHTIKRYNDEEMCDIFYSMIKEKKMKLSTDVSRKFLVKMFKENKNEKFPDCGGDVENVVNRCCMRCNIDKFGKHPKIRKIITRSIVNSVIDEYKNDDADGTNKVPMHMYV